MLPRLLHPHLLRARVGSPEWRRLCALAVILVACQRREGLDERTPVLLGGGDEWTYATSPAVPLDGGELKELTRRALEQTGRLVAQTASNADPSLSARLQLRLLDAEVTPDSAGEPGHEPTITLRARLRVEFRPALSDDSSLVTVTTSGDGRGPPKEAAKAAVSTGLARALEEVQAVLLSRAKSDDELVNDLAAADAVRARTALEQLAARRHPAAFSPLVTQLRAPDADGALQALSLLVILDDVRAVRPIIDEADARDLAFTLQAVYALGSLGGEDAEAYLFTVDSGHPDARVRAAAHEALEMARRRPPRRQADHRTSEESDL